MLHNIKIDVDIDLIRKSVREKRRREIAKNLITINHDQIGEVEVETIGNFS